MGWGKIITIVRRSWEASPPNTDLGAYPQDSLNLKEKEKEISENEPVQAIHSQDIATESKNDSKDVDDNDNDDINFTVTNTGIIRDNIFGDNDESDEKDMDDINDPSDGKEVVTRGSETTDAGDGDEP
jgi:hypothetical protein